MTDPDGNCPSCKSAEDFAVFYASAQIHAAKTLVESASTLVNPIKTFEAIAGGVKANLNPLKTLKNIKEGIVNAVDTYMNGTPAEAGKVQGTSTAIIAEAIVGSKGAGVIGKTAKLASKIDDVSTPKLIGPAGDPGAVVTSQIPNGWKARTADSGSGTLFVDPSNPKASNVRVMNSNPNSPHPSQQVPYVKQTLNGKSVDVRGNPVSSNSSAAHIPRDQFKFNRN